MCPLLKKLVVLIRYDWLWPGVLGIPDTVSFKSEMESDTLVWDSCCSKQLCEQSWLIYSETALTDKYGLGIEVALFQTCLDWVLWKVEGLFHLDSQQDWRWWCFLYVQNTYIRVTISQQCISGLSKVNCQEYSDAWCCMLIRAACTSNFAEIKSAAQNMTGYNKAIQIPYTSREIFLFICKLWQRAVYRLQLFFW